MLGPVLYYKQLNDTENRTLIIHEVHLNYSQFYEIEVSFNRNGFLISNNTRIRISGESVDTKTLSAFTDSKDQVTRTGSININFYVLILQLFINTSNKAWDKSLEVILLLLLLAQLLEESY